MAGKTTKKLQEFTKRDQSRRNAKKSIGGNQKGKGGGGGAG